MEVKIGVQYAPRELVLDSAQSPDEVERLVDEAITAGRTLTLADERGRKVVVPVEKLAYVEIGEPEARRVGFGAM